MYPNVYEKMIDIYPKITKYQVVVHDNKNLCVCHLTFGKKEKSNIILYLFFKVY